MTALEFLEYQYGITLKDEKALIHIQMLVKAMTEYADMMVAKAKTEYTEIVNKKENKGNPDCPLCRGRGEYSYGGSFGGPVITETCKCVVYNQKSNE